MQTPSEIDTRAAATVREDSYLTLHYRLGDDAGNDYVSTYELGPATLQLGCGQLATALEQRLLGLRAGDHRVFDLSCDEAYGRHNPRLVERIALSALPPGIDLTPNTLVEFADSNAAAGSPDGATSGGFVCFLRDLSATSALFDFNHPLAGKAIRFEVDLIAIL